MCLSNTWRRTSVSRFDDVVPDRVAHEVAHRVQLESFQNMRAMGLGSLGGDTERDADLLVGFALG